jgi:hypothetical protein
MSLPRTLDATPLDVLFPEDYARSKDMIVKDFAFFGVTIVLGVIGLTQWLNMA